MLNESNSSCGNAKQLQTRVHRVGWCRSWDEPMPAPPEAFLMYMNVTWECQIACMTVSPSTEQGSSVNCDPLPPLQPKDFMTFNVDNLSINISSTGSPVTPVTYNFESGHRHTLLVWAPSNYQVVSSWAFPADSDSVCCWRHGRLVLWLGFTPMWYCIR